MSKSLKQEQDDLFAGLEDILPTKKQLSFETRNANPIYIENLKKAQARIKDDPKVIANRQASADKKSNDPEFLKNLKERINQRFAKQNGLVYTPYGIFRTVSEGAVALNIDGRTLGKRIKEKADYFYIPVGFDISQIDVLIKEKKKTFKPKIKKTKSGQGMSKPLQTPFGLFLTLGICYSFIKENNIMKDPGRNIPKLIKNDPKNYYHISQQEYIMLTGKEI
jgi:hypothetical protein